jgi:hypothetical protein
MKNINLTEMERKSLPSLKLFSQLERVLLVNKPSHLAQTVTKSDQTGFESL